LVIMECFGYFPDR